MKKITIIYLLLCLCFFNCKKAEQISTSAKEEKKLVPDTAEIIESNVKTASVSNEEIYDSVESMATHGSIDESKGETIPKVASALDSYVPGKGSYNGGDYDGDVRMYSFLINNDWEIYSTFEAIPVVGIFKTDTLIKEILAYKDSKFRCDSLKCTGSNCDYDYGGLICQIQTDSVLLDYFVHKNGKHRYPNYMRIIGEDIRLLDGRLKLGMTWEEFLKATERNDFEYHESAYFGITLESGIVYFYFIKGILREIIYNSLL
jgi:hypothetical protein